MRDTELEKLNIGISIGDTNGIGIELILRTFKDSRILKHFTPIIYGGPKVVNFHKKALRESTKEKEELSFNIINRTEEANAKKVNLLVCWNEEVPVEFGKATALSGRYAYRSLEAATRDLKKGKIQALVTCPIGKNNIQSRDFNFSGHTEYLQHKFEAKESLMFLLGEKLRVALVSNHLPVKDIAQSITKEKIIDKLVLLENSLKIDFGIAKPKIAVLALNPHAGDGGLLGKEEIDIIIPALEKAAEKEILAIGPFSSDGFFASSGYNSYDAILAMYHDQGLIPFKLLEFGNGVNFTAGLSVVRTSPDHGTGYAIAGKGVANIDSFRKALFQALDIYKSRFDNLKEISPIESSNKEE